jgi:acyl-CoA synthetase (AMP-forming)/AMP-acid ligase II
MRRTGNLGDLTDRALDPDAVAVIDAGDWEAPRCFTHGEIDARADAVARALLARGHRAGERIAILAANSADYLVAYFGTMRAGLVSVPINWKFPKQTIAYILRDADVKFAFIDAERAALCPEALPRVAFGPDFEAFLDPGAFDTVRPADDTVAMFLYTSGSTGRPKGVPLTHRGHLWAVELRLRLNPEVGRHRFLVAAPLYHMNALAISKVAQAGHGCEVILPQFTAERYIGAIERFRCSWLTSVPTMIALVAQEAELLGRSDVSSVEVVTMGSAPATQGLFDSIRRIFAGARIAYGYGTTEAGPCNFGPHPDGLATPDLSIGYPLADAALRLVDGDDRDAREGELEVRCPANMPGYHGLPEKTAEAITADGYYRTGDLMRRDENGFHYFVGRVDDMFVCNGENVYPLQVERLLETHAAIEQACVVPVADEIRGRKPVAFVVAANGREIDAAAVKQHAIAGGPAYQHPREVWFVDELPLASTNKIDRNALARQAAALSETGRQSGP